MELEKSTLSKKLPIITLDSDIIGTSELQKVSSSYLDSLKDKGPKIVSVGGLKRAVLVDYGQYIHLQDTFKEVFKQMSVINQFLPRIPNGHQLHIESLRLEISGTLRRIVEESPDSSPFVDLMDAMLGIASGLFESNDNHAPTEVKSNVHKSLLATAKKVTRKNARPKRNFTE